MMQIQSIAPQEVKTPHISTAPIRTNYRASIPTLHRKPLNSAEPQIQQLYFYKHIHIVLVKKKKNKQGGGEIHFDYAL